MTRSEIIDEILEHITARREGLDRWDISMRYREQGTGNRLRANIATVRDEEYRQLKDFDDLVEFTRPYLEHDDGLVDRLAFLRGYVIVGGDEFVDQDEANAELNVDDEGEGE